MMRKLTHVWIMLLALSLASTFVAMAIDSAWAVTLAGAGILLLGWAKARLILHHYLGLAQAPFWQAGFDWALALFMLGAATLFLIPLL